MVTSPLRLLISSSRTPFLRALATWHGRSLPLQALAHPSHTPRVPCPQPRNGHTEACWVSEWLGKEPICPSSQLFELLIGPKFTHAFSLPFSPQ